MADSCRALSWNFPHVECGFHELIAGHCCDAIAAIAAAVACSDAIEATLAGDDDSLRRVAQHRIGRRLVRPPGTRAAGATLLLPHHFTTQKQPKIVLKNAGDVSS